MIEQPALIAAVRHPVVWVRGCEASECGACAAGHGCGAGWLLRCLGARRDQWLPFRSTDIHAVGDRVVLRIPEQWLLLAACIAYGTPLLGLLVGAVVGDRAGQDASAITLGAVGFVLGSLLARVFSARLARACPLVLRANGDATERR